MATIKNPITIVQGGGSLDNYGTIKYLDANDVEQTLTLATEDDYLELTLGVWQISNFTINNVSVDKSKITGVTIGDGVQYIPDNFCYNCTNLTSATIPSSVHYIGSFVFYSCKIATASFSFDNVISIGESFMQGNNTFNSPLALPKVIDISTNFLRGCSAFNSSLTINDGCEHIGLNFLRQCSAFAQSLSVPSGLYMLSSGIFNPNRYFMYECNNFVGPLVCNCPATSLPSSGFDSEMLATTSNTSVMYTTGVTLTGPYASDWKTALPDRTSSPYRKLIVGS